MDLKQHLLRQMAFSHATFGPGRRMRGVIDHIRKELKEVEKAETHEDRVSEWVDVVILALDGLTRELIFSRDRPRGSPAVAAADACGKILGKQSKNEAREWPDWREAEWGKAIEHVRRPEGLAEAVRKAVKKGPKGNA